MTSKHGRERGRRDGDVDRGARNGGRAAGGYALRPLRRSLSSRQALPVYADAPVAIAMAGRREVGGQGTWTVSSHKGTFGVERLRDNDVSTFWQYAKRQTERETANTYPQTQSGMHT
jgi:hypothetical protein